MILNIIYQFLAIIHLNSVTLKTATLKKLLPLFGTYQSTKSIPNIFNIDAAGTSVALSDKVKLLGVTLDRHLTLDSHLVQVCRSAQFHTRVLRHIRNDIPMIQRSRWHSR